MLPVKAVREAVVETLINWQEQFVSIVFFVEEDSPTQRLPKISSTYIPEGFSLKTPVDSKSERYFAQYQNGTGNWFTVCVVAVGHQQEIGLDNEFSSYYFMEFQSNRAIWGIMEDGSNTLVWESNGLSYQVIGDLDLSELVKISEGIHLGAENVISDP